MAITTSYTWNVSNLLRDTSDGFITDARWTLTGIATQDAAGGAGIATMAYAQVTGFGTVRPDPMIAYNDVTESNVVSWIEAQLGSSKVTQIKLDIAGALQGMYNPPTPTEGKGLPW